MKIVNKNIEIDGNWDGIYLGIDLCDTTESDFFTNQIGGIYDDDSRSVTINEIEYDINTINILNIDDVKFIKLSII